ncbi:hypothetical protein DPMN_146368 [Dreissena polymorpha]|uniref:Uncharacterized protein n=1 Tax=Dreissena polymorpha TaxID=45954 RepID=A0A9D4F7S2_DREPO|nr:hypothetical protein DPMN_146368 [Dreissena polymorpha]
MASDRPMSETTILRKHALYQTSYVENRHVISPRIGRSPSPARNPLFKKKQDENKRPEGSESTATPDAHATQSQSARRSQTSAARPTAAVAGETTEAEKNKRNPQ